MKKERLLIVSFMFLTILLVFISIYDYKLLVIAIALLVVLSLFLYFLKGNVGLNQFVLILIPTIVLSPMIDVPGIIGIRLDDLWLAFGAIVYITKVAFTNQKFEFKLPRYSTMFIIFIAWITISIFISSFKEPYFYSNRDWLEVYKNLKLLLIIVIANQIIINKTLIDKIFNVILFSLSASALFGIMQYFNLAGINSWLTPHFLAESQIKGLEVHGRIVGTYANPNVFGTAMLVGIGLSIGRFFQIFKLRYLFLALMFLVATFLTLSRTSLIACFILIFIISFQSIWKSRNKLLTLASFIFIPIIGLIALKTAPEKLFFRAQNLNNLSEDASFQGRLDIWRRIFNERTLPNIYTGTGPVSNLRITYDNEWLMIMTLYGIVGLILLLTWFYIIYRNLGKLDYQINGSYIIALRSIMVVYGISMFMEPVFQQLQLMPLIALMIGVLLNSSNKKAERLKKKKLKVAW